MASVHNSSDPALTRQEMVSVQNSTDPGPTCQKKASVQISSDPAPECTTSNELDLLFSPMFDELLNGSTKVVSKSSDVSAAGAPTQRQQPTTPFNNHTTPAPSCQNPPITTTVISSENITQAEPHAENAQVVSKSSAVSPADAPYQRQQPTTPLNNHKTPAPTCQTPTIATTVISSEHINQAEPHAENEQVADDEFINILSTPVQDKGRRRHVMLIHQICTLSINVIRQNTVGQKIIQ
uniref:Integrase, catalytic region, zinc finger, CCHC-type, peptidase aspartic, catalytic n=1 Tax=Tanacetum cinerariifolium TaxID=118510 RepID=A0A699QBJ2_TANCI|nr:hypothetical protein [Tanacetum cinerariifolium]